MDSRINLVLAPEFRLNEAELARLDDLIDTSLVLRSDKIPSDWYQENMIMPASDTYPGPVRYDRTPFWAEPANCAHPDHPALDITIMGPAQMGKSVMVLNAIIAYCIAQNPVNILFLTGHSELSKDAMEKIDYVIKCCGLTHFIEPSVIKKRNNKTGDTAEKKEFRGVSLKAGSITNHNLLRQNTARITIADDLDAGKIAKEETGSTIGLIKGRVKASEDRSKRYWVSTPQTRGRSMIEIQFNKSDKRYWFVQCPHCGTQEKRIKLDWSVTVDDKNTGGIFWKLDKLGRVDPKSVGYVCQLCSGFFDDRNKHELLNSGIWMPTQDWVEHYHYGYGINGLYAPHGMTSWFNLASRYVACNPEGQQRNEPDYKTWINVDIGDLYDEPTETLNVNDLQVNNVRSYEIGVVPEAMGMKDGNGQVVMMSLTADANGTLNDARLDWELVAWFESGANASVKHGSIGTFIPNQSQSQKDADTRERWSYDISQPNNVWKEFHTLVSGTTPKDHGGSIGVFITAIDVGHCKDQIYEYIDAYTPEFNIVGVMGDKEHEWQKSDRDVKYFAKGKSRLNLYLLNVNRIKDNLARQMRLKWNPDIHESQPVGFMNFPNAAVGLYDYKHYFSQFEAEEKRDDKSKGVFIWQKKGPTSQNHFWDIKCYHLAARDIFMEIICKEEMKLKDYNWQIFVDILMGR